MRCLDGITDAMDMNFSKLQEMVRDREAWCAVVHGASKDLDMTGRLNNNDNNSCFTMLPQFLLYSKVNQLYAYTNPLPLW